VLAALRCRVFAQLEKTESTIESIGCNSFRLEVLKERRESRCLLQKRKI
jgi:hypothetical protein